MLGVLVTTQGVQRIVGVLLLLVTYLFTLQYGLQEVRCARGIGSGMRANVGVRQEPAVLREELIDAGVIQTEP